MILLRKLVICTASQSQERFMHETVDKASLVYSKPVLNRFMHERLSAVSKVRSTKPNHYIAIQYFMKLKSGNLISNPTSVANC